MRTPTDRASRRTCGASAGQIRDGLQFARRPPINGHTMSRLRFSITAKLLASFGVLIVFLVATMAVAFQLTGSLRDDVHSVGRTQLPNVQMLGELTTEMRQYRVAQLEHSLSDAEGKKELDGEIAEVR